MELGYLMPKVGKKDGVRKLTESLKFSSDYLNFFALNHQSMSHICPQIDLLFLMHLNRNSIILWIAA
jgi:hypothetical protein